ncbi:MAG: glycerol-3-phosphate 1-O-acyltransferase PlsY [Cyanobacteria bacterium P01_F01_bin.153]
MTDLLHLFFFDLTVLALGYSLGSLPTGYLLGRVLRGIDLRDHGSGSTGATNALRVLGKKPGAFVLVVDILKGVGAVLLARYLGNNALDASQLGWLPWLEVFAGLSAVVGHSNPIWLGFRGGKSVATGLGILFALSWPVGLATFGVFALCLSLWRIVSLSSISGAIAVSALMVISGQPLAYCLFAIAAGGYVVWRHRSNIQRLIAGVEPRIGQAMVQK